METLHGIALNIFGTGVIITGVSAIGKSELGLALVDRGHKFIVDDAIRLTHNQGHLHVHSNQGKFILHIRGIGFIDVLQLYGINSVATGSRIDLNIELTQGDVTALDRLTQLKSTVSIFGVPIHQFVLPVGEHRPLILLVELIVKYYQELERGIDSHSEFIQHHDENLLDKHKHQL